MRSGNFTIYKSIGAAQFSLMPPKGNEKGYIEKEGAILLEAAPGDGNKSDPKWDWSKKLKFAIGLPDIAILMDQVKEQTRVVHDNQGTIKSLELKPGQGTYEGTYILCLAEGAKETRKEVKVPLTNGEYQLLMRLLSSVAPLLINWTVTPRVVDVQDTDR